MVQTPNKILTLEEFLTLPETQPSSEYIDGQIIQKPMPQGKHSTIQGELCPRINSVIKVQKIGWAFPELRCTYPAGSRSSSVYAGSSIVPDVAVFSWAKLPIDDNGDIANTFTVAPDWIIEILSPEQSHTKVTKKILHALNNGTQMGWLIDPDERFIAAYPARQQPLPFEEINSVLPVPNFCQGLQLTLGEIFGWLKVMS